MPSSKNLVSTSCYSALFLIASLSGYVYADEFQLNEVIVSAEKREKSLQDTPIAISVLNEAQLERLGVTSLNDLKNSIIPSLKVLSNGLSPSTLTMAIRGDGGVDVNQPTRQGSVATYLDGIYLGRAQGLTMELADLNRIEVARGPQGTLYGRNATGGAVHLVSNKPTGEFGVDQMFSGGNFNAFKSVTRVNLPEVAGISTKLDYIQSERDGWVENTLPGQADFNEYNKQAARLSLSWAPADNVNVDYTYDQSDIESAQMYHQLYEDSVGPIGPERERETRTRYPLVLDPVKVDSSGHALIATWSVSDSISVKSLSSYRKLDEDGFNNHGGTLGLSGLILDEDIRQDQYSQEFQLIGSHENLEWSAGVFYFNEDFDYDTELSISLDPGFNPIDPPIAIFPVSTVTGDSETLAAYGQGTMALSDQLSLTAGVRVTNDKKTAIRGGLAASDIDANNTDTSVTLNYDWTDDVATYVKWGTAHKAGGYNTRALEFTPFDEEQHRSVEVGLKSEWLDRRLRLNTAAFVTDIEDKQFDLAFFEEAVAGHMVEAFNSPDIIRTKGFEIEMAAVPVDNLVLGLNYTYLDSDVPNQPHPNGRDEPQPFTLSLAPEHAGSVTFDYSLSSPLGLINTHLDVTSTSPYAFLNIPSSREDAYTLINARVSLDQIALGQHGGSLSLSLWARNLADEEYIVLGFPQDTTPVATNQIYGTPRTAGIDVIYTF